MGGWKLLKGTDSFDYWQGDLSQSHMGMHVPVSWETVSIQILFCVIFSFTFFLFILDLDMVQVDVLHVSTCCVQVLQPLSLYLLNKKPRRLASSRSRCLPPFIAGTFPRTSHRGVLDGGWNFGDIYTTCCSRVVEIPIRPGKYITRWWFHIFFIFIPTWGNDPILLINIFSNGLKPPTRSRWWMFHCYVGANLATRGR